MPAIIRTTEAVRSTPSVAFNFDDMAVQANWHLQRVRLQAAEIVAKAQREAGAIRAKAQQEGEQAGRKAIEQIVREQLATAMPALAVATREIQQAKQDWLTHWEANAVHLAAAIARRVVRRELRQQPEITLTLIREALELAAGSPRLLIRLSPEDHEQLGARAEMLVEELAPLADADLVADPEITLGGCRVETHFGLIDQQIESQLKRIEEELT